ncbi:MAG: SocA family protein [Alphaproteobacteria bacterium]|nr:SocA family protein [Alphaproteobacteria bacterium]
MTVSQALPEGLSRRERRADERLDPRGVCNMILDQVPDRAVTNVALQRLLYLAHGLSLARTGHPLVYGYFEAWRHGPVHPAAHAAFKLAAHRPITFRALKRHPLTHVPAAISCSIAENLAQIIRQVALTYSSMPVEYLVELCVAPRSPWEVVVDEARTGVVLGMIIPDDLILDRYKYHKVQVGLASRGECPREDRPYS